MIFTLSAGVCVYLNNKYQPQKSFSSSSEVERTAKQIDVNQRIYVCMWVKTLRAKNYTCSAVHTCDLQQIVNVKCARRCCFHSINIWFFYSFNCTCVYMFSGSLYLRCELWTGTIKLIKYVSIYTCDSIEDFQVSYENLIKFPLTNRRCTAVEKTNTYISRFLIDCFVH